MRYERLGCINGLYRDTLALHIESPPANELEGAEVVELHIIAKY